MNLQEFIETFAGEKFKLTDLQRQFINYLESYELTTLKLHGYKKYSRYMLDDYSLNILLNMKEGSRFAFASIDGIHVFEKIYFKPYNSETIHETPRSKI